MWSLIPANRKLPVSAGEIVVGAAESVSSRSLRALAWGAGGGAGRVIAQLVVQVTLARLLDPLVFGQYALVLSVIAFGYILADGGFGSALTQKKLLTDDDVAVALGWCLLLGVLLALVVIATAPFLAAQFGDATLAPVFQACAVWVPLLAVANIPASLLRRDLRLKGLQIIQLLGYTAGFGGVAMLCAVNGFGVWSLVAGFSAQTVFTLIATFLLRRHGLRLRLCGDGALVTFGAKSLATDLAGWSMDSLDRVLVGRFWGVPSLGLYSVAYNLSKAPIGFFAAAAQGVAFAAAARLQDDLADLREKFQFSLVAACFLTIPLFTLIALESTAVLDLVYGKKWLQAAPYMSALAAAIPFISIGMLTGGVLRGLGHVGQQMRIQMMAVAVLVGGFVLLRDLSLSVAVWLVPATYLLRAGALLCAVCGCIGLPLRDVAKSARGAVLLSALGATVCIAVDGIVPAGGWVAQLTPLFSAGAIMLAILGLQSRWFLSAQLAGALKKAVRVRLGRQA